MARTRTLANLRADVRNRADMSFAEDFITDAELTEYINQSIARLYNIIVNQAQDHYIISTTQAITPGTNDYALPNDFYKLRGVDILVNGVYVPLQRESFYKRSDNNMGLQVGITVPTTYRVVGSNIRVFDTPSATTIKLWYIPAPTRLSADSDTFDGISGFEEWVVIDSAIKCKVKQEDDVSILLVERGALQMEIIDSISPRDMENECMLDLE